MWTLPLSAANTTVFGSGWLTSQAPSAGVANPESGNVVRSGASLLSSVRTTSCPLAGSPDFSRNCGSRSCACTIVPPRLENTNRTWGVESSISRSGRFTTGAAAAPAGALPVPGAPGVGVG